MTERREFWKHRIPMAEIEEAMENYWGFCRACGSMRECCEPDASEYLCEECGEREVYGAQELLIMGQVE